MRLGPRSTGPSSGTLKPVRAQSAACVGRSEKAERLRSHPAAPPLFDAPWSRYRATRAIATLPPHPRRRPPRPSVLGPHLRRSLPGAHHSQLHAVDDVTSAKLCECWPTLPPPPLPPPPASHSRSRRRIIPPRRPAAPPRPSSPTGPPQAPSPPGARGVADDVDSDAVFCECLPSPPLLRASSALASLSAPYRHIRFRRAALHRRRPPRPSPHSGLSGTAARGALAEATQRRRSAIPRHPRKCCPIARHFNRLPSPNSMPAVASLEPYPLAVHPGT